MTNARAQRLLTVLICLASFGLCPSASAQSPPPDSTALIEALKPKAKTRELDLATAPAERDRVEKRKKILGLLRKKGTRGLSVEERTDLPKVVSDRPSVDMEIYFDYNSAEITYQANPHFPL
jgi:hypothetical protein